MAKYRRITKREYDYLRATWSCVDATFWHAVNENNEPAPRIHNNYRHALVCRNGNDLYFCSGNRFYELPTDEYKFIEGDVNVKVSLMDRDARARYFEPGNERIRALVYGIEPHELPDVPVFDDIIDTGHFYKVPHAPSLAGPVDEPEKVIASYEVMERTKTECKPLAVVAETNDSAPTRRRKTAKTPASGLRLVEGWLSTDSFALQAQPFQMYMAL